MKTLIVRLLVGIFWFCYSSTFIILFFPIVPGIAGGVFREEGQNPVATQYSFSYGASPFITKLDLVLVDPHIMSTFFEVGFYQANKFFVVVVAVGKKDSERGNWFGLCRNLSMFRTDPEITNFCKQLMASGAKRGSFHKVLIRIINK
jgi:hypothetical protein